MEKSRNTYDSAKLYFEVTLYLTLPSSLLKLPLSAYRTGTDRFLREKRGAIVFVARSMILH